MPDQTQRPLTRKELLASIEQAAREKNPAAVDQTQGWCYPVK
jgi:hypothetical protein